MEDAIDSGFEPVGTKYRYDHLKEVKRVIYKRCFEEGRKFFDMYAEHTREALDEEMKHLIFCHRFLIPYEETERIRNRWKRQDKIFEIQEKSADGVLKRLEKDRMYKDCVLADVHASAIDEFRVKMDDNMKEAINKAVDSRQFAKLFI
ncbi:hypothetical protein L5515_009636 [Caenorhabditis briggsae]|uniref:Uncharacterized protein n=1 Tax=Caenorhabditis briggsae TaxID=6238 RepID=A0AAE9JQA6_CAEBR|nr:hypothetical protein L5515_009636 [Caenorhabditis briggsae]